MSNILHALFVVDWFNTDKRIVESSLGSRFNLTARGSKRDKHVQPFLKGRFPFVVMPKIYKFLYALLNNVVFFTANFRHSELLRVEILVEWQCMVVTSFHQRKIEGHVRRERKNEK